MICRCNRFRAHPGLSLARLLALIADCTLFSVEGVPQGRMETHPEEFNTALLTFLGEAR